MKSRNRNFILPLSLILITLSCSEQEADQNSTSTPITEGPKGMVWIPGGNFQMGAPQAGEYPREYPAHMVRVDGFWMDETQVTNRQFEQFVNKPAI